MKKTVVVCLCIVLIIATTVGNTIAVTKDSDGGTFPILSGAVSVEVIEEKRSAEGGFAPIADKSTFFPEPVIENSEIALASKSAVSWKDGSDLLFWDAIACATDKIVTVANNSARDAYVRVIYALEDTNGVADKIHLNVHRSEFFAFVGRTEINGTPYKLYSYTYDTPLKAGETSVPSLLQFVCGGNITASELVQLGDSYDILISAEAVQTVGFSDPEAALNAMFGEITALNHPWA